MNLLWSYSRGEDAGGDPWDAWTLEWSVQFAAARHTISLRFQRSAAAARFGILNTQMIPTG